jgi:hypothetical protein
MKSQNRPLAPRECAELQSIVSWQAAVGRAVIFAVLIVVMAFAFRAVNHLSPTVRWWPIASAIASATLFAYAKRLTGGAALRDALRKDLAGGIAEAHEYDLQVVAVFPEVEDEGPVWLFPDGNRTIRISGQKLVHATRGESPRTQLRITTTPHARRILDIACAGKPAEFISSSVPFAECPLFFGKKLGGFYETTDVSWSEIVNFVRAQNSGKNSGT